MAKKRRNPEVDARLDFYYCMERDMENQPDDYAQAYTRAMEELMEKEANGE